MNSARRAVLKRAVYEVLIILARIILRCGMGYREFADAYRRAFVEAAYGHSPKGKVSSAQQISLITGIPRRDVMRYRDENNSDRSAPVTRSPAAKILQVWFTAKDFLKEGHKPKVLYVAGREKDSFQNLIRRSSVDLPLGAVRAVLVGAGAVVERPGGGLQAIKRYFVPGSLDERILEGLNFGVLNVMKAIERNTAKKNGNARWFQREVHSARIPTKNVEAVRRHLEDAIGALSVELDDLLLQQAASCTQGDFAGPFSDIGVGLYYVDEDLRRTSQ